MSALRKSFIALLVAWSAVMGLGLASVAPASAAASYGVCSGDVMSVSGNAIGGTAFWSTMYVNWCHDGAGQHPVGFIGPQLYRGGMLWAGGQVITYPSGWARVDGWSCQYSQPARVTPVSYMGSRVWAYRVDGSSSCDFCPWLPWLGTWCMQTRHPWFVDFIDAQGRSYWRSSGVR